MHKSLTSSVSAGSTLTSDDDMVSQESANMQVHVVNISGDILHTIKPVFSLAIIDIDFIALVLTPVWWFASVHCLAHLIS